MKHQKVRVNPESEKQKETIVQDFNFSSEFNLFTNAALQTPCIDREVEFQSSMPKYKMAPKKRQEENFDETPNVSAFEAYLNEAD